MLEYGTIECRTLKCETECWTLERLTEYRSTYIVYITVSQNKYHKAYNIEYIEYTSTFPPLPSPPPPQIYWQESTMFYQNSLI